MIQDNQRKLGEPHRKFSGGIRGQTSLNQRRRKFLGAGERIRTVDLRIPSASSGSPPQPEESPESPDPQKTETSETEGNLEDL